MKRKIEERYLSVSVAPPLRPIAVSLRSTGTRIDIFLSLRIKHETNIYIPTSRRFNVKKNKYAFSGKRSKNNKDR